MANRDLHNFHIDLIEDISFIQWVQSDFEIDNDKWSLFVDENMDHMGEINKAISFIRALDFKEESALNSEDLWNKIALTTQPKSNNPKILRLVPWQMMAAIASVSIAILMIFKPFSYEDDKQTFKAQIAKVVTEAFPDGSAVTINPGSEVTFDVKKWETERNVSLKGLAFFKVRKGNTFTVETDKGKITVLGTSFSVDARNDRFEVICKTGKVAVLSSFGEEKILEAGDVATLVGQSLLTQKRPEGAIGLVSWLDGDFTFNDIRYKEVIDEIENQFGVKVKMEPELYDLKYTGFFKNNHLNDALFSITWPLKLKYSIKGNEVFIVKE